MHHVDGMTGPGPAWRLRFWAVFGGQSLSLVGSALTQFVLLWWITAVTGSVWAARWPTATAAAS